MKKLIPLLAALLLVFSACAEDAVLPAFAWEHDGENHWQLDDAGAIHSLGAHTFSDEISRCTVCGCDVLDWGDGTFDVTDYDEYDNVLRYASFTDGVKAYERIHCLTLNEDGLALRDVEYINGVRFCERIYTVSDEDEQIPVTQTVWNDDGTTSVSYYDEYGNCIRNAIFEADGSVSFETLSEFALNDYGWYYECKTISRFNTGESFYRETNQYGDTTRSRNTNADGTAWSDWTAEYEYLNGIKVWRKQYEGGVLINEQRFNQEDICVQETEYQSDGSRAVILYDEYGDTASITTFAADGSVMSTDVYEYVYDDDMNLLAVRISTDGVLTMEIVHLYAEDMSAVDRREIFYHPDGTFTVKEYDSFLELLRTVVYAADGSILSEEAGSSGLEDGAF